MAALRQFGKCRAHSLALVLSPSRFVLIQLGETEPRRADGRGKLVSDDGDALGAILAIDEALLAARVVVPLGDMALAERLDTADQLCPECELALKSMGPVLLQQIHGQSGDDDLPRRNLLAQLHDDSCSGSLITASRASSRPSRQQRSAFPNEGKPAAFKLPPKDALAVLLDPRKDALHVRSKFGLGKSDLCDGSVSAQSGFVCPTVGTIA